MGGAVAEGHDLILVGQGAPIFMGFAAMGYRQVKYSTDGPVGRILLLVGQGVETLRNECICGGWAGRTLAWRRVVRIGQGVRIEATAAVPRKSGWTRRSPQRPQWIAGRARHPRFLCQAPPFSVPGTPVFCARHPRFLCQGRGPRAVNFRSGSV